MAEGKFFRLFRLCSFEGAIWSEMAVNGKNHIQYQYTKSSRTRAVLYMLKKRTQSFLYESSNTWYCFKCICKLSESRHFRKYLRNVWMGSSSKTIIWADKHNKALSADIFWSETWGRGGWGTGNVLQPGHTDKIISLNKLQYSTFLST